MSSMRFKTKCALCGLVIEFDPAGDGYYWVKLSNASDWQIVQIVTGTAWGAKPSKERRTAVVFMGMGDRVLLAGFGILYPNVKWGSKVERQERAGARACGRYTPDAFNNQECLGCGRPISDHAREDSADRAHVKGSTR